MAKAQKKIKVDPAGANQRLLNPETQTMTKLRGIFTSEELKQAVTEQF